MTNDSKHEECPHCNREVEHVFHYPLLELTGVFNETYNASKHFPEGYVSPLFEEEIGVIDVPEDIFYKLGDGTFWPSANHSLSVIKDGFIWTKSPKEKNNPHTPMDASIGSNHVQATLKEEDSVCYRRKLIVPFETINRIVTPHLEHIASFVGTTSTRKEILYPDGKIRSGTFGSIGKAKLSRFPPFAILKNFANEDSRIDGLLVRYTLGLPEQLKGEYPELSDGEYRIFMSLTSFRHSTMTGNMTQLDTLFGSMTCKGKLY